MTFTIQLITKASVTIDLGKVKAWGMTKDANLEMMPLPFNDVQTATTTKLGTQIYDINGPIKSVVIESDLTGEFDTLNQTVAKLEKTIDGLQQGNSYHTLRSNYVTTTTTYGTSTTTKDVPVKVNKVNANWQIPGLNRVHFILELYVFGEIL